MKALFIFSLLSFFAMTTLGQNVVDVSKTKKITEKGMEITTFEGKPFTGFLTEAYLNGSPKTWITVNNGLADGLWQEWFENGKLKYNAYWKAGKGHGLWQYFYDNGVLRYEETYVLDIPTGISRTYYMNGQLKDDNLWLSGKKEGVWKTYSETGLLLKTSVYQDDKLISSVSN